jgi:hypothetical protein
LETLDIKETPELPEFVLDQQGDEVHIGDTIAYAVLLGRSASLSIGKVLDFQWSKSDNSARHLRIKVQGYEPWSSWSDTKGGGLTLKKPGYLRASFRRFVKIDPKNQPETGD